jgi:hypothetical protein
MPRGRRTIEVQWPAGGVNERFAFQKQPPYTCVRAQNVCTEETIADRMRGGSRPGLETAIPTQCKSGGTAYPINMLDTVRTIEDRPAPATFTETFPNEAYDSTAWTDLSGTRMTTPTKTGTTVYTASQSAIAGASLDFTDTDASAFPNGVELTKPLTVEFTIPCNTKSYNANWESDYFIFFKMDDTSPDIASGIVVHFALRTVTLGGTTNFRILSVSTGTGVNGLTTSLGHSISATDDLDDYAFLNQLHIGTGATADFTVRGTLEPEGLLRVAIRDQQFLEYDWSHKLSDFTGDTVAFGIMKDDQTAHIDDFALDYIEKSEIPSTPPIRIVAGSNGEIWREIRSANAQVMGQHSTGLTLTTEHVATVERFGTLYMADHGVKYTGTGKAVSGAVLTDATVDFTTAPAVDDDGDYCEITSSSDTTNLPNGTYEITSHDATTLTLTGVSGVSGTATYRVVRGLKTYASGSDAVALHTAATAGSIPVNCKIIALYRDRLCLAGDQDNAHVWYMSRQGDLEDWNYSGLLTDGGRPVAGTLDTAGVVNRPLTALIPSTDDYLIFAAADAMWILRGDPAMQGFIDVLSRKVGIIDHRAWTTTPEGVLYFVSKEGVYKVLPGSQQYPIAVSKDRMPKAFRNIDTDLLSVTMQYDLRRSMIHVYLTSQVEGTGVQHYWIDTRTDAFWPMTMRSDHEPIASCLHESLTGETNTILLGGRDAYIRRHSTAAADDDGSEFESSILLGPFGKPGIETMLHRLQCTLHNVSSEVYWYVQSAESAKAALHDLSIFLEDTYTWDEDINPWDDISRSGVMLYLGIATTNRWALESLIMELEQIAEWRPA